MWNADSDRHLSGDGLDEAIAQERSALEALLESHGVTLEDPEIWAEPLGGESEIGARPDVPSEEHRREAAHRRASNPWMVTAIAAIAALVVAVTVAVVSGREPAADWSVDLAATDAAPAATATVLGWNGDAGTRLSVSVDGLEPAPEGFVYELWFSNKDRHISAGTFAEATELEMLVGIRRGDFPRIWITLEPLDADPGPGLTVLDTEA